MTKWPPRVCSCVFVCVCCRQYKCQQ